MVKCLAGSGKPVGGGCVHLCGEGTGPGKEKTVAMAAGPLCSSSRGARAFWEDKDARRRKKMDEGKVCIRVNSMGEHLSQDSGFTEFEKKSDGESIEGGGGGNVVKRWGKKKTEEKK